MIIAPNNDEGQRKKGEKVELDIERREIPEHLQKRIHLEDGEIPLMLIEGDLRVPTQTNGDQGMRDMSVEMAVGVALFPPLVLMAGGEWTTAPTYLLVSNHRLIFYDRRAHEIIGILTSLDLADVVSLRHEDKTSIYSRSSLDFGISDGSGYVDSLLLYDPQEITVKKNDSEHDSRMMVYGVNLNDVTGSSIAREDVNGKDFCELVLKLRDVRKKELHEEKQRAPLNINFSAVRAFAEKGGMIIQAVKCPSCGASLELPSEGSTIRCEYCHTTIIAQDLLERMQKMLN